MKKKKNQRKLYVADRVWCAPEIDLEAAKAAETTLLTTSAAESRAGAEPAAVSEKLQISIKRLAGRCDCDNTHVRELTRTSAWVQMQIHELSVHVELRSPHRPSPECRFRKATGQEEVNQQQASIIPGDSHPPTTQIPRAIQPIATVSIHKQVSNVSLSNGSKAADRSKNLPGVLTFLWSLLGAANTKRETARVPRSAWESGEKCKRRVRVAPWQPF